MSDFLKGNFKPRKTVQDSGGEEKGAEKEKQRRQAIESIGGSMVFVDDTQLAWDPEKEGKT